jgi:S-(hydroxymethyl)glutathione dehydrogenase/alcohol dehydrogenase
VIGNPRAISQAFDVVGAGGEAIVVGVSPFASQTGIDTGALLMEKVLNGCLYGSARPRVDIPHFIDLWTTGRLKLDELISRTYPLEGINEAFAAMKAGEVTRSIVTFQGPPNDSWWLG